MIINLRKLVSALKRLPIESMGEDVLLTYDITGFKLVASTEEETRRLNKRWDLLIKDINRFACVEEYLTVAEVANHLHISKQSVLNILKRQDGLVAVLPYVRTDKGIRIKTSDYLIFLAQHYNY